MRLGLQFCSRACGAGDRSCRLRLVGLSGLARATESSTLFIGDQQFERTFEQGLELARGVAMASQVTRLLEQVAHALTCCESDLVPVSTERHHRARPARCWNQSPGD
jgi:hypothetical protein